MSSVFSRIKGFLGRHRNKLIVGGVIVTGSIILTNYAQQKLIEWQERQMMEFLETNRKQQHFHSIIRTCNQMIGKLSIALNEAISQSVDTDSIVEQLRNCTTSESKTELWNRLKVMIFVKASCTVYSTVMLIIMLKLQLSIIGGYLYKDSTAISAEMQEKYLSICQYLFDSGVALLATLIEEKCKAVLEPIDLSKELRLSDLETIFWSIQTSIAQDTASNPVDNLRDYILPEIPKNTTNDLLEKKIMLDTVDLLDSDEVKCLTTYCINRSFIVLGEHVWDSCQTSVTAPPSVVPTDGNQLFQVKKPLTKLLLIVSGIFTQKSLPDPFLQQLINNDKLLAFSANIYEALL